MSQEDPAWSPDFADMMAALLDAEVRFLVVGAHALAVHGIPRATMDLDVWVECSAGNAARVMNALDAFGAPLKLHGVTQEDFETPGTVYQLGLPPARIDLLTQISGVDFEPAWQARVEVELEGRAIPFIGAREQLANKRAAKRPKDLVDATLLERKLDP